VIRGLFWIFLTTLVVHDGFLCSKAEAFCAPESELASSFVNSADEVLVVRVTDKIHYVFDDDNYGDWKIKRVKCELKDCSANLILYKADVAEVLKGSAPERIILWTEDASARADLDDGKSYLIFCSEKGYAGTPSVEGYGTKPVRSVFWTWGCDGPFELSQGASKLKEVRKVMEDRSQKLPATVQFRVSEQFSESCPKGAQLPSVGGILFSLNCKAGRFSGKTNAKGTVTIRVPAGDYKVSAKGPSGAEFGDQIDSISEMKLKLDWGGGFDDNLHERFNCH